MVLLAKRVSALEPAPNIASTSETPSDRAACWTNPKISWQRSRVKSSDSFIGDADFYAAEARRTGAMACPHDLLGLTFAAIRRAPQCPMLRTGDGRAGVPKFRTDAAIARVLQHANALTIADLPGDFAAELNVVALV